MTISAIEPVAVEQAPRLDWPFLLAATLATALLVALIAVDTQWASAALVLLGFALGIAFLKFEFSFAAAWRRFISLGQGDGLLAGLLLIAVTAAAIVPITALVPGYGGAIALIGPSLVVGAFVFGIGMQLANGCGSGTLYTVGGGSGRMLITLAFFIAGSVIGRLSSAGRPEPRRHRPGSCQGLLRSVGRACSHACIAWRRRGIDHRSGPPTRRQAMAEPKAHCWRRSHRLFVDCRVCRRRSPLERDVRLHALGREDCQRCRDRPFKRGILAMARPEHTLANSVLSDTSSLTDFGMIFGAMAAASFSRPFARNAWPPLASLAAAATGGLLMGWGARLGFGCNIGAFVGGVASGSLHGWVWFACALGGCTVGIRLRPLFGLSRE